MDDVSLKQMQTNDKELDSLIFNGEAEEGTAKENQPQTHDADSDSDELKKSTASTKSGDRSSVSNVLPVDKLKNGANTASKVLGQTFSMFKERSGAALEAAKSSNAGKTIAGGLNSAANASQETYGKLKESDAFKKSSNIASGAYERTSLVASGALEKARAASTTGLGKAKSTAAAGIETIKSKTGGKKGEDGSLEAWQHFVDKALGLVVKRRCFSDPPEDPIATSEGHAVLTAWKRGHDGCDPVTTYLLTAANGVHRQLGDASSEFILLVDATTRHTANSLRRKQGDWDVVSRTRLSRAFGELKWELQREFKTLTSQLYGLRSPVLIELDSQTVQSSQEFRDTCNTILISALRGVSGEQAIKFLVDLVLKWVFTSPCRNFNAGETIRKYLFRRTQQFLKGAPNAIIFMVAPSVYGSYVVSHDEFILKKSVVASQPPDILGKGQKAVLFACFGCSLSLSAGSNHVELATTTDDEFFTVHDAARLFILKFVRRLRDTFNVALIISTEAIDESVIAAYTRQRMACFQFAEPKDIEALCICAGIVLLTSAFDDIRVAEHIGRCTHGVSRVRFQQQAYLRLHELTRPSTKRKDHESFCYLETNVVPQVLIYAPSKGVYKQYYAAIVKSLRVFQSWWEPTDDSNSIVYCCKGGGATELVVARWLQDANSSEAQPRDPFMVSMARKVVAYALIEVVSTLRINLSRTNGSERDERSCVQNQRRILLNELTSFKRQHYKQEYPGYTLDYSRTIMTGAGPIQIPELVLGDPAILGLIHPWRRIETLLFLVLETLEQLFRVEKVI